MIIKFEIKCKDCGGELKLKKELFNKEKSFRVTRKAVYVFCRWDNLKELPKPKSVIAWVKNNWSMGDLQHEHGRQWEAICFYPMDEHEFEKRIPDVIMANRIGNNLHPTEKPLKLIRELIRANKGQLIFDPFAGSGTTMVACKQLGKDFIGIEIDKGYCDIANKRLEQSSLTKLTKDGIPPKPKDLGILPNFI